MLETATQESGESSGCVSVQEEALLVFEYVDHTLLDELQRSAHGLDDDIIRKYLWQILSAVEFCHANDVRNTQSFYMHCKLRSFRV